jgi:hypothetical protein
MPESVTDRLSTTYELLFLLTPSQRYYFDLDPIRQPLKRPDAADGSRVFGGARKGTAGGVGATARRRGGRYGGKYAAERTVVEPGAGRGNLVPLGHAHTAAHPKGRNLGDVWTIATRPYRGSHVAPFPLDLPLRAIAAGCPPGGVVLDPFSKTHTFRPRCASCYLLPTGGVAQLLAAAAGQRARMLPGVMIMRPLGCAVNRRTAVSLRLDLCPEPPACDESGPVAVHAAIGTRVAPRHCARLPIRQRVRP